MEKYKIRVGKTKGYLEYCKQMHDKSPILKIIKAFFSDPEYNIGQYGWLNGSIRGYQGYENIDKTLYPFMADCTIGNGYVENGKQYFLSNVYDIQIYNGSCGITIIKHLDVMAHGTKDKYFVCGDSKEPIFGNFSKKEDHEQIEIEEIVRICNKDWKTYKNINTKNKYNIMFLEEFKAQMIKRLLHCKIIFYDETEKQYKDFRYR